MAENAKVPLKTRIEILAMMREAAITEEYTMEVGLKVKRRFMITMPANIDMEFRTKMQAQVSKEEHQLEQQQKVVGIIEEMIADQERSAAKT